MEDIFTLHEVIFICIYIKPSIAQVFSHFVLSGVILFNIFVKTDGAV